MKPRSRKQSGSTPERIQIQWIGGNIKKKRKPIGLSHEDHGCFFSVDFPLNQCIDTWFSYGVPMVFPMNHHFPYGSPRRGISKAAVQEPRVVCTAARFSEANSLGYLGSNKMRIFGDML